MTNEENEAAKGGWLYRGSTDIEEVGRHYDEWAEAYDHDIRGWGYNAPETVAELVVTHAPGASSILDAGCGTGLVGAALRSAGFSGELRGIDLSEVSLRLAEETGAYQAVEWADLQQPLSTPDDSVDVVVCVGVMTYVPDVEAAWREFARVTRPGGVVVVTQRNDLWEPRDCQGVIDRLTADHVWTPLEVTEPQTYLPGTPEGMGSVPVRYVTARVD